MTKLPYLSSYERRRWLIAIVLGLGLVWIAASRNDTSRGAANLIYQPYEGFAAPDFELLTSTGKTLHLSDLRGKAVILNFWASWCPPCRAEMPAIESVHREYQESGLVVLGVNASDQDNLALAQEYADSLDLTFQVLFDTSGSTQKLYAVSALPTTFFIDREGIIRRVVIGGPMAEAQLNIQAEEILGGAP